jgi:hypothetical protein
VEQSDSIVLGSIIGVNEGVNNAKVGIGTTTPVRPLDIASGQLRFSSALGAVEFTSTAGLGAHVTTAVPDPSLAAFVVGVGSGQTTIFTVLGDGDTEVGGTLKVIGGSCTGCSPPSDRSLKTSISAVNPRSILDKLASVPVQSWRYKTEPETVRHIGPMAQDFRAAFGLGESGRTLNTVDAQGVTMASVQALYQMMLEKEGRIERQERRIERLEAQLRRLRHASRRKRAAR